MIVIDWHVCMHNRCALPYFAQLFIQPLHKGFTSVTQAYRFTSVRGFISTPIFVLHTGITEPFIELISIVLPVIDHILWHINDISIYIKFNQHSHKNNFIPQKG